MEDEFRLVGSVVDGKYRVDRVIGAGGFSVVYAGVQLALERDVALKFMRLPTQFNADARRAFFSQIREEGKLISKLSAHPAIVGVYDFGILGLTSGEAVPYLVLERLKGISLHELLARLGGPLSEREACALMRPVIDGLAHAHRMGIAHRDLKPANLFCTVGLSGPGLRVLDFGIAKAIGEGCAASHKSTGTSHGVHAFSPQYAAPEQFRSAVYGATGAWTDVHAVGLLLTELVTGKPALGGATAFDYYEVCLDERRPTPRAGGAEVSDEFEDLCGIALALRPEDRFQSAAALLRAMDEVFGTTLEVPLRVREAMTQSMSEHASDRPDSASRTEQWILSLDATPSAQPGVVFTPVSAVRTEVSPALQTDPFVTPPPRELMQSGSYAFGPPASRDTVADPPPEPRRRGGVLVSVALSLVAVGILAVGAGAWWMGQRDTGVPERGEATPITFSAPATSVLVLAPAEPVPTETTPPPAETKPPRRSRPPSATTTRRPPPPPPTTASVPPPYVTPPDAGVRPDGGRVSADAGLAGPSCGFGAYRNDDHRDCCKMCDGIFQQKCNFVEFNPLGLPEILPRCSHVRQEGEKCYRRCDASAQ